MQPSGKIIGIWCFLLILFLVTGGCSTTTNRQPVDLDKAVEDHVQLALNYISEGERKKARHHLLKAIDIDKKSAGTHNGLALLYQLEQEDELADKHYKKAIGYDKDFTRARNNYGIFLYQKGRFSEAREQFIRASEDTHYELRPQVFYALGLAAQQLKDSRQAEESWRKAIVLQPRYAPPYLELAELAFEHQSFAEARRILATFDQLSRPTPRSLWLAVRIESHFGNRDALASKGLALEKLFPDSRENQMYQTWRKDETKR